MQFNPQPDVKQEARIFTVKMQLTEYYLNTLFRTAMICHNNMEDK